MKSLDELIEEIRREARGQPEAPPARRPDEGPPVSERDFDISLDVDLEMPAHARRASLETEAGPPRSDRAPDAPADPEPGGTEDGLVEPRRVRTTRRRLVRGARALLLVGLAVVVGAAGLVVIRLMGDRETEPPGEQVAVPPLVDQDVVTWAVWDPDAPDTAFVTVFAGGGDRDPLALGVPGYTVVIIPGYGTATVGDAAAVRDPSLVAGAVENLLGVRVDAWEGSSFEGLAAVVDRLGGIEADSRAMTGREVIRYLTRGGDDPAAMELRFLRWQEVTGGLLRASAGRADALAQELDPQVAAVLGAAGTGGAEVLELPVSDIGSGLGRPDAEAVEELVAERFVPTRRTGEVVRLAVLNGVGTPGVGDRVARVLGPAGFQLVSSGNAQSFDVEETQIIAVSRRFIPEAELARRLLGVGKVYLGDQSSNVFDVQIVVGSDFGGA